MKGRTVREFPSPKNLWSQVEAWAAETGFKLDSQEEKRRVYRRGNRLLTAPLWVEIRQQGKQVVLEAWVTADFYLFLSLLSGKKPETAIESGGLTACIPRRNAREAVNRLLARFGQQPVT